MDKSKKNEYEFCEISPEEYVDFVEKQESNNFLQSIHSYNRYKNNHKEVFLLGVKKKQKIVLAALIMQSQAIRKEKIFSTPGGPITDYNSDDIDDILAFFTHEVKQFLKKNGGAVLQVSPYISYSEKLSKKLEQLGYKNLGEYIQAKWIMVRDMSNIENADDLMASFRSTHRQNTRYALNRHKLEIRELGKEDMSILVDAVKESAAKHHFIPQKMEKYEEMFDAFGNNVKILAAFYGDIPVSSAMFVIYGNEVVYLYSGSDPRYLKTYGSYALQWHMLKYCIEHKIPRYNFFGTKPFEGDGVYEFKRGFRGETLELQGTYMLPLNAFGRIYTARKKYQKYGDIT